MDNELKTLVVKIRDWQKSRSLSDNEICKRFAGLGSTKTYKRILEGEVSELDLDRWQMEYSQVWTLMELESATGAEDEPVYNDLWHVNATRVAVAEAMREAGNNRIVIVEGPSGAGKTVAGRCLAAYFGRKMVLTEADETWKDSLNAMLGGCLRSLGVKEIPNSADGRKTKLLEILIDSPVCLIVDEAHHLGPRTLNLIKTLVNQTRCQMVFLCIETLFKKLECSAYEEARQLTKNRLCERIRLTSPKAPEIEKFLGRRVTFEPGVLKAGAALCEERARQHGCWNFVVLVARQCLKFAGKKDVDEETFGRALQKVAASR